ncbi:MAG TPA: YraN family protein [Ramlibacter sp.]|nr:YraN family protein [Ramlibacter sp.]
MRSSGLQKTGVKAAGVTTKARGDAAEDRALAWLQARGLRLAARNYRTPGRGGGEIDLVLWDRDGTLVFVEVRQRASRAFGGAAASIGADKQRRIVFAARHYLLRLASAPPCRFDVISMEGGDIQWMRAAFDAG